MPFIRRKIKTLNVSVTNFPIKKLNISLILPNIKKFKYLSDDGKIIKCFFFSIPLKTGGS